MPDESKQSRPLAIVGGKVVIPNRVIDDGCIVVRDGRIAAVGRASEVPVPRDAESIDAAGLTVAPGLIDLHIHGFAGQDVADGDIGLISEGLARCGVTAFLAALTAAPHNELLRAVERLAAECSGERADATSSLYRGARLAGIYLEGPYLSPSRAGALSSQYFRLPDLQEAAELLHAGNGQIRVMAVAPELAGARDLIGWLSSQGVAPSVGHSDASFDQVAEAARSGLRHATHTFNAMRGLHHREPGVAGAVLDHSEIVAEVIADGYHVHSAVVRLVLKAKGADGVCLVSDCMPFAGLPAGAYTWLGQRIVTDGLAAKLESGVLAGSVAPLNVGLRNLLEMTGLPVETALKTVSSVPARVLSLNSGAIEVGRDADIAVFDGTWQSCLTIVRGVVVYRR